MRGRTLAGRHSFTNHENAQEGDRSRSSKNQPPEGSLSHTADLVLVVEDDEMVRSMVSAMLEELGYEVLNAGNGLEAVEIFQEKQDEIGLVLSDVLMPGMDGWKMLAALRSMRPDIPVILASGCYTFRDTDRDHREQPQATLHKPFKIKELKETVERVLEQSRAQSGL